MRTIVELPNTRKPIPGHHLALLEVATQDGASNKPLNCLGVGVWMQWIQVRFIVREVRGMMFRAPRRRTDSQSLLSGQACSGIPILGLEACEVLSTLCKEVL